MKIFTIILPLIVARCGRLSPLISGNSTRPLVAELEDNEFLNAITHIVNRYDKISYVFSNPSLSRATNVDQKSPDFARSLIRIEEALVSSCSHSPQAKPFTGLKPIKQNNLGKKHL